MEEFFEKQKYTYERPCEICGFPVDIKIHDPEQCANAKKDKKEEIDIEKEISDEEWIKKMSQNKDLFFEENASTPVEQKIENILFKPKKEIPKRLEKIINVLADKIERKVKMAADATGTKKVEGEYQKKWIEESFLLRIFNEQLVKIPADWVIILEELESRVPEAAKEFVKKYRENYEQKLRRQGIL